MNTAAISNNLKSFYKNKRCLVTGSAGFIGSHLVEALIKAGASVNAMVHYNSNNNIGNLGDLDEKFRKKLDVIFGDIRDAGCVSEAVKDADIVFHLAALISIPYSYVAPKQFIETNIIGSMNIFEACKRCSVKKIVHTSTSETYGTARYVPQDEKHPLQGQSPYSASKIGADKLAESYFLSYGLPVTILRPFNTYGPRQSSRAVIPTIISQTLFAEKIHVGSLTPKRDFNYINDTVAAFLAVGASDKTDGEVFNTGSGKNVSIGDILGIVKEITGHTHKPVIIDEKRIRPEGSEVKQLLCDYSKLHSLTGWKPSTDIKKGLKETIDWISCHKSCFDVNNYSI